MILSVGSTAVLLLGLLAIMAYLAPALLRNASSRVHSTLLLSAWILHGATLTASLLNWGQGARFGFGPAVSVTAWLVLTVYALELRLYPKLQARWAPSGLGAVAVLLGLIFPGATMHAQASVWLPLHWALGIASYGLFAAAVMHAWLMTQSEQQMRKASAQDAGVPLMTLERLMFALIYTGFALLSATLLVGGLFSEYLYGRGASWKWNHKTVFSVASWIIFALLIWARYSLGLRGRKAVNMLYLGAGMLFLAYIGSRFVIEIILQRSL